MNNQVSMGSVSNEDQISVQGVGKTLIEYRVNHRVNISDERN